MAFRPQFPSARILVPVVAFALVLAAVFAGLPGCASKHNGPTYGGGGGGGNTPKELDSGDITNGNTYAHTFNSAGSFSYHCNYHGVMTGTVTVNASAAGTAADVDINSIAPFPAASVKPGGTVTWHNNTAMTHTVTSN